MSVKVGDRIPDTQLGVMRPDGPQDISTRAYFEGRKIILFAVPGAFTPTCNARHLPGFIDAAETILARGIDAIACVSVNDVFVMEAWSRSVGAERIEMLADGNGDFASAMGMLSDSRPFNMGFRSRRYALIANDGVIESLLVDEPGFFRNSSAEKVLSLL